MLAPLVFRSLRGREVSPSLTSRLWLRVVRLAGPDAVGALFALCGGDCGVLRRLEDRTLAREAIALSTQQSYRICFGPVGVRTMSVEVRSFNQHPGSGAMFTSVML